MLEVPKGQSTAIETRRGAVEKVIVDVRTRLVAQLTACINSIAGRIEKLVARLVGEKEPLKLPDGKEVSERDESLQVCLEQLKDDFARGIVRIDEEGTPEQYTAALQADKTAGQTWKTIEARLRANGAVLLRKAATLPGGACLVGVYRNGELAIRQRDQKIVCARWTEDWKDGETTTKGELQLLPHAEAMARTQGRWAQYDEIRQAVTARGYHVPTARGYHWPKDSPIDAKKGLVAASEAVMGVAYVRSADGNGWPNAILDCGDLAAHNSDVRVVCWDPYHQKAFVYFTGASYRGDNLGAILWLIG